ILASSSGSERRVQGAFSVRGSEFRVRGSGFGVQGSGHAERRTANPERRTQNPDPGTPNAERRTLNPERRTLNPYRERTLHHEPCALHASRSPSIELTMRSHLIPAALLAVLAAAGSTLIAQDLSFAEMRWRDIGPTRAGRARALAGVPSQPNTFYAGFDNGGVWRSTDYGANWVPLFDDQSTGSIGAIAVAPSNPGVIYVGSGAGIIRPDLAIGNGIYKSTDGGRTWEHLGLRD